MTEGGIMRIYEMGVKQRKRRRKSSRPARGRADGGGGDFFFFLGGGFYFNLYISSETNVLCLLIVH